MEIKILPLTKEYVNDNDVSVERENNHLNEDQTNVNNNQITEGEPKDKVLNFQVNSRFVIPSNQNKIEKKSDVHGRKTK